ncbi:demethoxyubiquinone hydroxylase family protein, partial [Acinetobacter baumannii]
MRHYTGIDQLINSFDQALRSLVPGATAAQRQNPAETVEAKLGVEDARHVAG